MSTCLTPPALLLSVDRNVLLPYPPSFVTVHGQQLPLAELAYVLTAFLFVLPVCRHKFVCELSPSEPYKIIRLVEAFNRICLTLCYEGFFKILHCFLEPLGKLSPTPYITILLPGSLPDWPRLYSYHSRLESRMPGILTVAKIQAESSTKESYLLMVPVRLHGQRLDKQGMIAFSLFVCFLYCLFSILYSNPNHTIYTMK